MSENTLELSDTALEDEFYFVIRRLTEALNEINPHDDTYRAAGQNVGWQNQSGETTVTIEDGADLIRKLTPDSGWQLKATITDEEICIRLTHHDSPTGETHTLTAANPIHA